jgi:uroporphyrinogen decarboxylase
MTGRERALTALRRMETDRPPLNLNLCAAQIETMKAKTGKSSLHEVFPLDVKTCEAVRLEADPALAGSKYLEAVQGAKRVNEWGIGFNTGNFHFESMVHPLAAFDDEEDAAAMPMPYPVVLPDAKERFNTVKAAGFACVSTVAPVGGTVFWPAYKLRGMEQLLCDMISAPEYAEILFDRVMKISIEMARANSEAGSDIVWLADDFGTQRDLMMSLEMWRHWFKDRLARVVDAAKSVNPYILVALHSDGKIDAIIPDLIDIGIDILNPLQPECMDPADIKRRFGSRLAFWGGIGTQTTMPFGTAEDVRRETRSLIDSVGKGGGLLVAPTHVVEPEVPWDNILALVEETVKQ